MPRRHRVASKSRKKRLCRLLCGKPLAFRRRQPPFFPSARLEGSPSSRAKGVSQGGSPRKGEAFPHSRRQSRFGMLPFGDFDATLPRRHSDGYSRYRRSGKRGFPPVGSPCEPRQLSRPSWVAPTSRLLCRRPLRSQDRPRIGRGDRDVARVRGAHTSKTMYGPPAMLSTKRWDGSYLEGVEGVVPACK